MERYQLENILPFALTVLSLYFWLFHFEGSVLDVLGILFTLVGLPLWWAGKLTLGENWFPGMGQPRLQHFVPTGIYAKIRHPIYLGVDLTLLGIALLYGRLWFGLVVFCIVVYFSFQMVKEEKFLRRRLGNRYRVYKERTWF